MQNQQPTIGFVMPNSNPTVQPSVATPPYAGYPPSHQPFPQPIQIQPTYSQQGAGLQVPHWVMPNFQSMLTNATTFKVKQKVDLLEAFVGWEVENRYIVYDQYGNKLFFAGEESDCFGRQCFGSLRSFSITLKDSNGTNVLSFQRPLRCGQFCCCMCCPHEMRVTTPRGQLLGSVAEEWTFFSQKFSIRDATGRIVLYLTGPFIPWSFRFSNVTYSLRTINNIKIGSIQKEFGGLVRELFTDADQFSITFPVDLAPDIKAVVLGALFLIDFMYYESGNSN